VPRLSSGRGSGDQFASASTDPRHSALTSLARLLARLAARESDSQEH
jgi:hypothetical protein